MAKKKIKPKAKTIKKKFTVAKSASKSNEFVSVYVSTPDRDNALKVAQTLVNEKLVACFNIFENITSVYRWHNELEKSTEVIMIGKTQTKLQAQVTKRIKELNSYEVPCIVYWPIADGFPLYLEWIKANTK